MRAVNLIPAGNTRGVSGGSSPRLGLGHAVLGLLAVLLVFVTVYVLSSNTVSDRRVKLAAIQLQLAQAQAQANQLGVYTTYVKLAQARSETVRQIAASRFDWHGALADLAQVLPGNSRLQSLLATVAPGVTVSGAGGSTGGGGGASTATLRGDIAAPAFELRGCTDSHEAVARLISRLRLINGVQRVTLADSVRAPSVSARTTGASGTASAGPAVAHIVGCGANPTGFDVVVFFQSAGTSGTGGSVPGAPAAGTPPASSQPVGGGSSQPVNNASPAGSGK